MSVQINPVFFNTEIKKLILTLVESSFFSDLKNFLVDKHDSLAGSVVTRVLLFTSLLLYRDVVTLLDAATPLEGGKGFEKLDELVRALNRDSAWLRTLSQFFDKKLSVFFDKKLSTGLVTW